MKENKLTILWTNADPITSKLMVMMYATAGMNKGFWEQVTVVIWGATVQLVAEDALIQKLLLEAKEAGVTFSACKACAEALDVMSTLQGLGIDIRFWGQPLTDIIKAEEHLITI